MKIYALPTGDILQIRIDNFPGYYYDPYPPGTYVFEFDEATNPILVQDIISTPWPWSSWKIIGGILQKDGVPITINPGRDEYESIKAVYTQYPLMPDWVRNVTPSEIESYITNQIWNGYTIDQVDAWIDTNVTGTSLVTALASIKAAMKIIAAAIISMRGYFVLIAKLLLFIRDLTIKFHKSIDNTLR